MPHGQHTYTPKDVKQAATEEEEENEVSNYSSDSDIRPLLRAPTSASQLMQCSV